MLHENFIFQVISVSHNVPNELVVYKTLNFHNVGKTLDDFLLFNIVPFDNMGDRQTHSLIHCLWKVNRHEYRCGNQVTRVIIISWFKWVFRHVSLKDHRIIYLPKSRCVNAEWRYGHGHWKHSFANNIGMAYSKGNLTKSWTPLLINLLKING